MLHQYVKMYIKVMNSNLYTDTSFGGVDMLAYLNIHELHGILRGKLFTWSDTNLHHHNCT